MTSVGEALALGLRDRGVEVVFGIPGVHTIELYRGLPASGLRHVTPRHEQGAGFMADGYARVSGKPGVAFVITGPGLTNTLTAMAQARADSVPMLVISGVNARATLGMGLGELHELPDQRGMAASLALMSLRISSPDEVAPALDAAFGLFASGRGGPVHIEVPTDVMPLACPALPVPAPLPPAPVPGAEAVAVAARRLDTAEHPVILAGGGCRRHGAALAALAERLDAPVVQTVNARGLMHGHPLAVPASPSLAPVRDLLAGADAVLALGTEFGLTDYDMYKDGRFPDLAGLVRVDIDATQLARRPAAATILAEAGAAIAALVAATGARPAGSGARRAAHARAAARAALAGLNPDMPGQLAMLEAARAALPGAIIVGDSTQPVYAGNLFYDHDRPGGWFNAATGYGALALAPAPRSAPRWPRPMCRFFALPEMAG
ncbi:MAG: 5-guanidino-2-oxopentanoate decarboxylase [Paracoccaceae bacterium]